MIKIVYIGNNFAKRSNYNSAMETLSNLLIKEGFMVIKSSSVKNKGLRLLDMCFAIFKHKKTIDYILIDTFSTLNFQFTYQIQLF